MSDKEAPADSLAERAYRRVRAGILSAEIPPGYFLSEREICERFRLSRAPVREAVRRLREEGLVEVLPRRGVRVLPLSIVDVREIHQIAKALELEAASIVAARKPSREDLGAIEATVVEMEAAIEAGDRDAWVRADTAFHLSLVGRSGNQRLIQTYHSLRGLTDRARLFALYIRELPVQSTREHRAMLEAILADDQDELARLYRAHWERTTEEMVSIIQRQTQNNPQVFTASQIVAA